MFAYSYLFLLRYSEGYCVKLRGRIGGGVKVYTPFWKKKK